MKINNCFDVTFPARSENEGFARVAVAVFCLPLKPSLEILSDIKTAVSEAVTNSVVHAYSARGEGMVRLKCMLDEGDVVIDVFDYGVGIKDIARAREPFFTTKPSEERSGMGFAVMESFMDELAVENQSGGGLHVHMRKRVLQNMRAGAKKVQVGAQ